MNTHQIHAPPASSAQSSDAGKLAKLQERAARAGHSLLAVPSGFLLVKACGTSYSGTLAVIAAALASQETAAC